METRSLGRPIFAALVVAVLSSLSGCGPDVGTQGDVSAVGALERLDQYLDGRRTDLELVANAYTAHQRVCLAAHGFDNTDQYKNGASADPSDWERLEEARLDYWWGVSLPEYAAQYGYREVDTSSFMETEWTATATPPPEYWDALFGPGYSGDSAETPGGCEGDWLAGAYSGVSLSQEEMRAMALDIREQVEEDARGDSAVVAASLSWSECMAKDGYRYGSPHAALSAFATVEKNPGGGYGLSWRSVQPTEEELRVATADAECKVATGFWDAIDSARDSAAARLLEVRLPQLEALREANERIAANVVKLMPDL
jgi:hypothetical protein